MAKMIIFQEITGIERKTAASVIADTLQVPSVYAGPPSFSYKAGNWEILKDSMLTGTAEDARTVFNSLSEAGAVFEGALTLLFKEFTEQDASRMKNVIESKRSLIKKALQADVNIEITSEQIKVVLEFYNPPADFNRIWTAVMFFDKLQAFSSTLKYAAATEKTVENEKYTFRCFLLRLGFIGDEYKAERKQLLKNLSGNSAFKVKAEEELE